MSDKEEFLQKRRKSRELALQLLYQLEVNKEKVSTGLEKFIRIFCSDLDAEIIEYCKRLVVGTMSRIGVIDRIIKKSLKNWTLDRISIIDKCILRYAIYEICEIEDTPRLVSINEAIEIAKEFGTSDSSKFINGILDTINNDEIKNELIKILRKKAQRRKNRGKQSATDKYK